MKKFFAARQIKSHLSDTGYKGVALDGVQFSPDKAAVGRDEGHRCVDLANYFTSFIASKDGQTVSGAISYTPGISRSAAFHVRINPGMSRDE